jgi:hypothetical protein
MNKHWRKGVAIAAMTLISATSYAAADYYIKLDSIEGESTENREAGNSREVSSGQQPEPTGLLLPAVQKAQEQPGSSAAPSAESPATTVQPQPQKGIEPDEIDRANRATDQRRPAPARAASPAAPARTGSAAGGRASVQQMMLKLRPRQAGLVAVSPGGGGAGNVQMAQPEPSGERMGSHAGGGGGGAGKVQMAQPEPPKYEIADCGTATSPMICCHHEQGDGSSCNLFKILCENAGGTAQGDGESAACSDW